MYQKNLLNSITIALISGIQPVSEQQGRTTHQTGPNSLRITINLGSENRSPYLNNPALFLVEVPKLTPEVTASEPYKAAGQLSTNQSHMP